MNKTKYFATIAVSLALVFIATTSYAVESFTGNERAVFLDIAEGWHNALIARGYDYAQADADISRVLQDVANKHNISLDEVRRIDNKGLDGADETEQDYKIYDDLCVAYKGWNGAYDAGVNRQYHENFARQYGISVYKLYEIEYVMEFLW